MELKVWVNSVQRVVCGVTPATTCQDVIIALAQAMGRTGRFNLIERWRGAERPLGATDSPLEVLQKWGEYAHEVKFVLRESAVKKKKKNKDPLTDPVAATRAHRGHAVSGGKGAPTKATRGGAVKKSLSFSGASFVARGLSTPAGRAQQKKALSSAASLGARERGPDIDNVPQDLLSTARPLLPQSDSAESELNEGMEGGYKGPMSGKPVTHSLQPAAAPRPSMLRQTSSSASVASASSYLRAVLPSSSAALASAGGSHQVQQDGVGAQLVSGDVDGGRQTASRAAEVAPPSEAARQIAGRGALVQPPAAPLVTPLGARESAARVPLPRRQSRSLSIVEADSEATSKPAGTAASGSSSDAVMPSRASGTLNAGSPSAVGGSNSGSGPDRWDRRSSAAVFPEHGASALALSLTAPKAGMDALACATSDSVAVAGPQAEKPLLPVLSGGVWPAHASGPDTTAEASLSPGLASAKGAASGGRADAGAAVVLSAQHRPTSHAASSADVQPHAEPGRDSRGQLQSSEPAAAAGAGEKAGSRIAEAAAKATAAPSDTTQGAPTGAGTKSTGGHSSLFRALTEEVKGQQRASMLPRSAATSSAPPRSQPSSGTSFGTGTYSSAAQGGVLQNPVASGVYAAKSATTSAASRPPPAAGQASTGRDGAERAAAGQPPEPAATTTGRSQLGDAVREASTGPPSQAASAGASKTAATQRPEQAAAAVGRGRALAGSSAAVQQELRAARHSAAGAPGPLLSGSSMPQSVAAAASTKVNSGGQPEAAGSGAAHISGDKRKEGELVETSEEYERLLNVVSLQRETLTLQQSRLELLDKEIASRRQKERGKTDETAAMQRLLSELEATCKHLDRELEQSDGEHGNTGGHDEPGLSSAELDSLRREAERSRATIAAEHARVAECDRELSELMLLAEQLGAHVEACRQQLSAAAAAAAASGKDRDAEAECQRLQHLIGEERAALEQLEAECSRATDDLQKAEASVAAKRRAIDTVELELHIGSKGGDSGGGGPAALLPASSAVTATMTTVSAAAASGWSREERGLVAKAAAAARAPAPATAAVAMGASSGRGSAAAKGTGSGVYC